jgi:hypothetical protein
MSAKPPFYFYFMLLCCYFLQDIVKCRFIYAAISRQSHGGTGTSIPMSAAPAALRMNSVGPSRARSIRIGSNPAASAAALGLSVIHISHNPASRSYCDYYMRIDEEKSIVVSQN